jgi:hypothetical protein
LQIVDTPVSVDTENVPIINSVITSTTTMEDTSTPIVVIGDLGRTGTTIKEKIHGYMNMENTTGKKDI